MAATLPAIASPGGSMSGGGGGKVMLPPVHRAPSLPASLPSKGKAASATATVVIGPTGSAALKRSMAKKERELEQRRLALRSQQPMLTKTQAAGYRNSYKHNLCLDMLQEGFHKSFAELFALIKQQNEERLAAGPESALWSQVLLENEPDKLETLKLYLGRAEEASRKDDFGEVYSCQYKLARYFQKTGDKWLGDHFFSSCLATSGKVEGGKGKMAAEAHCNVGLALEESVDNFGAVENFELFYGLAKGQSDWQFPDGRLMHSEACNHLSRIYTTISKRCEQLTDLKTYLLYLKKAYEMAKEGGDRQLGGEASYRLGLAYEKNKDSQTALLYLSGYLEICQTLGDSAGTGMACEAMARSYESQGKVEQSIKYLEMFVEVAEKSKDDKAISRACSDLGAMFNSLGRYDQAVDFFNKSYNIARAMNDTEAISSSRVLFGVAAAHKMLETVAQHINVSTKPCICRLVEWKDNRGDDFDKPIPETGEVSSDPGTPATASTQAKPSSSGDEHKNSEPATPGVEKATPNTTPAGGGKNSPQNEQSKPPSAE